jgi:hypothetical protein
VKASPKIDPSELPISVREFLLSYNANIPEGFPKASFALLLQYRQEHQSFFKHEDEWSLSEHRKKIMDWLQLDAQGFIKK